MADGRQTALDQFGGDPSKYDPEQATQFLREGGQTDYRHTLSAGEPPFDKYNPRDVKFENRWANVDVSPVPLATQEDKSLLVYDYVQKQYNVNLSGGASAFDVELDVVEETAEWLIERVAIFGTAGGFVQLFDGSSADGSNCFCLQAGVAAQLGGVQSVTGIIMTPRTPLRAKGTGVDANAAIAIGVWYRKARWTWTPPKYIIDPGGFSDVGETNERDGVTVP